MTCRVSDCVRYSTVVKMSGRPSRPAAPSVTSLVDSNRWLTNIVPVEQHTEDDQDVNDESDQDEEDVIEVDDDSESESDDGEDGEIFDENQP